jgi:hypothetical protein
VNHTIEIQASGMQFSFWWEADTDPVDIAMAWCRNQTMEWWRNNTSARLLVDGVLVEMTLSYDMSAKLVPDANLCRNGESSISAVLSR